MPRLPKLKELELIFIGDEVMSGNFPPTFTFKSNEAQKERPDLQVEYLYTERLQGGGVGGGGGLPLLKRSGEPWPPSETFTKTGEFSA